jgi:hypothetical protein
MTADPVQVLDWTKIVLAVVFASSTVAVIIALTRSAVQSANERRAAVGRLLTNPQLLQRVWFVQREYNSHHEVMLYARDVEGKQVKLALPGEAPKVWHQLQRAGIMVHPEP